MKIGFIGFGAMAKALAFGVLKDPKHTVFASAPSLATEARERVHTHSDNQEVVKHAEIIILAVKPMHMEEVLTDIARLIPPTTLVISVATGFSLQWYQQHLHPQQPIIRSMPNTPAAVGAGATVLLANEYTSKEQCDMTEQLFATVGCTHWVSSEAEIDTFTALSGSGPAYVFLFVEALINAAVALGLEPDIAKQFALQTCKGSIDLAEGSDLSLSELRKQVTSPGGTTAAALQVLHPKLDSLLFSALNAAKKRAEELGANLCCKP